MLPTAHARIVTVEGQFWKCIVLEVDSFGRGQFWKCIVLEVDKFVSGSILNLAWP